MSGEQEYRISLTKEQWDWIVENERRVDLLELVENCTPETIVSRCREVFGFEPTVHLSGSEKRGMLAEEEKPFMRKGSLPMMDVKGLASSRRKAPLSGNRSQRRAQKKRK